MKLSTLFTFAVLLALACGEEDYRGYKTFRVFPTSQEQVNALAKLRWQHHQMDFWTSHTLVNMPVDVMVDPTDLYTFYNFTTQYDLNYQVLIQDVSRFLPQQRSTVDFRGIPTDGKISFNRFERYGTIVAYLVQVSRVYDFVSLINIGKSYEGRDILGVKIFGQGENRPVIFIDAGIHAREWIAPATALYIIHQLVTNPEMKELYQYVDWYIIPVLNPDGYEYSHTNVRIWRKTRASYGDCSGVDANRNFDVYWMSSGADVNPCSITFAGNQPFSEPETKAFRRFVKNINRNFTIQLYLSLHSFGPFILHPYGYKKLVPDNVRELAYLGELVRRAIRHVRGTDFVVGASSILLYEAAGGSDDWMLARANVPLSYTVELTKGSKGFMMDASEIIGIVREVFEGIKVYARYVTHKFGNIGSNYN